MEEVYFLRNRVNQENKESINLRLGGPVLFENGLHLAARDVKDRPTDLPSSLGFASGDAAGPDLFGIMPRRGIRLFF